MRAFLSDFAPPADLPDTLIGAVVPHAGWTYSGRVAARTLSCLERGGRPTTAVLFGTDHTGVFHHSLYPSGAWSTPLGNVPVDEELGEQILARTGKLVVSDPDAHRGEHALEVLLPMVKYLWPDCRIVPVTVRPVTDSVELGRKIGKLIESTGKRIVLIASTDLTHYGSLYGFMPGGSGEKGYRWMCENDQRMVDALCAADGDRILTEARRNQNACGPGAAAALAAAVTAMGHSRGYLVEYTTSHGIRPAAEFDYGVGYAGVVY
jgi:hypothetical protein